MARKEVNLNGKDWPRGSFKIGDTVFRGKPSKNQLEERRFIDGGLSQKKSYNRAQENQKTNRIVNEELNNL